MVNKFNSELNFSFMADGLISQLPKFRAVLQLRQMEN